MTCLSCHNTTQWEGATFDHGQTSFPLTGAHVDAACLSCHGDGVYDGLGAECVDCHRTDFDGTTDPNHQQAGFPLTCQNCHNTARWEGATFDHGQTSFPLTGAHVDAACLSCHGDGVYDGLGAECVDCHRTDFDGTTDPNHQQAGFPLTCQNCHNTARWEGATFDHGQTSFPLTGAHVDAPCLSCHANGIYDGLRSDCAYCHQSDYNGTTDPNHQQAGFPLTCQNCHNTSQWDGATFNHDAQYFPIYSGTHRNRWDECSDCHYNPNSYADFSCIICHEHSDEAELRQEHDEVSGFRFDGQACYECHPRGN